MKKQTQVTFKLNQVAVAVMAATASLATVQLAHAGAGWGTSTNAAPDASISAPNPALPGAFLVRTYYANSPQGTQPDVTSATGATRDTGKALAKFVDPLPGLVAPGGNGITVAVGDTTTYPGSVYYEIAVVEYTQQMHRDLAKATSLRGYVQIDPAATDAAAGLVNGAVTPAGSMNVALKNIDGTPVMISRPHNNDGTFVQVQAHAFDIPHYLGPTIVAAHGTPTRVKFYNGLPAGHSYTDTAGFHRAGDLFIPVDHTLFGGGDGQHQNTTTPTKDILCGDVLSGPNNAGDPTLSACGPTALHPLGGWVTVPNFDYYTENREELHLHGGDNPWISDGHPHQWITPAADELAYKAAGLLDPTMASYGRGDTALNVPDMPEPGPGAATYYWPNGQSGRLLFYHDHATGLTRLNVYAGTAAGYLLTDPTEQALNSFAPGGQIPLVIQDKTFVPADIATQDAKWDTVHWGQPGDLWFPHVYETNQDPLSADATNPVGRWDGASFFWPVFPQTYATPSGEYGNATTTPEAFMDTPIVNGTAYPTMNVNPTAYRFRILGVGNDRVLNLSWFVADPTMPAAVANGGAVSTHPTEVKMVPFNGPFGPTATTYACPTAAQVGTVNANGIVTQAGWTETGANTAGIVQYNVSFPCAGGLTGTGWGQQDGRPGGVPDPTTMGPSWIRIGNEGGLFQQAVVIPPTPMDYEYNKRSVTVLNVLERGLWLGPAERADVIVDFSAYAGKTLILYNDSGAPVPAGDPRIDYFTGIGDQTSAGGAPDTLPGYGPNTRTVMQVVVANTTPTAAVDTSPTGPLNTAMLAAYKATQPLPVVPTPEYAPILGAAAATAPYEHIFTGNIYLNKYNGLVIPAAADVFQYTPAPVCNTTALCLTALTNQRAGLNGGLVKSAIGAPVSAYVESKAIQELFEADYGRMNATLGVELPFTNVSIQTTLPLAYVDPATEKIANGETQFWKITHNGVDTHPVHFHFINVQVINRVGWDGTIKTIPADEVGWKETVKMHPLEDIIVAVRAKAAPPTPFGMPHSWRQPAPNQLASDNHGITQLSAVTGAAPLTAYTNAAVDYGSEYVWHCHILGHEENDFMRPFILDAKEVLAPAFAAAPTVSQTGSVVNVAWVDPTPVPAPLTAYDAITLPTGFLGNPNNEIGFRVERALASAPTVWTQVPGGLHTINAITKPVNALANSTSYADTSVVTASAGGTTPVGPTLNVQTATSVTLNLPAPVAGTTFTVLRNGTQIASGVTTATWTDTTAQVGNTYTYAIQAVTGAGGSVSYVYRVVAVTAKGETASAPSTSFAVTTGQVATPSSPALTVVMAPAMAGVTVTNPTVNSLQVNWGAAAGALSYTVAMNGGAAVAHASPDVFTGLAANTSYSFVVTSSNGSGNTSSAPPAVGLTLPAAPSALAVTAASTTASSVALTWTAPANSTGLTYTVQYSTNSLFTTIAGTVTAVSGVNPTVTGLTAGTSYWFRVLAVNTSGAGAPSNVVTARTTGAATTVPAVPVGLAVANLMSTSLTLNWTASTGAVSYSLQRATNVGFTTGVQTFLNDLTNSLNFTGLNPNTPYFFRVRATNAVGNSAYSAVFTVSTPALPATPAAPVAALSVPINSTSIQTITLTLPALPAGATSFTVYNQSRVAGAGGGGGWGAAGIDATGVTGATYTATPGSLGLQYRFYVVAVSATGNSANSPVSNAVTPGELANAPVNSAATANAVGTRTIAVNWGLPASNGVTITGIRVLRATNLAMTAGLNTTNLAATAVTTTTGRLTAATTYYFQVGTVTASGVNYGPVVSATAR